MLDEIRVSLVQMSAKQAVFDPQAKTENVAKIVSYIKSLSQDNDLVIFPELSTCGYTPFRYSGQAKLKLWEAADELNSLHMRQICEATKGSGSLFVVGFAERSRIKYDVFDSAALIEDGEIIGIQRKIHIGGEEVHYFVPGPEPEVFKTKLGNIGIGICYDMVFPEMPRVLALKGAEIIVFVNGFADVGNLKHQAKVIPAARALENQTHVIFCNGVGLVGQTEDYQLKFFGESKIISATGQMVAESLSDQEEVISGNLKKKDLEKSVCIFFIFRDRQINTYGPINQPYPQNY